MKTHSVDWLMLVASLPTSGATARMRLWRAVKALGSVALRDGAYLVPSQPALAIALEELARQTNTGGGQAWVLRVDALTQDNNAVFTAMFDRAELYEDLCARLHQARKLLASQTIADVAKSVRRFRKDLDALERIDFFPGDASLAAQSAWLDFDEAARALLSPGEPIPAVGSIVRLERASYQGRTWATRRNLWVDRVACAWLIRRFIDVDANFQWLVRPEDCPSNAIGFDFDGAAFTHVEDKVSFEVLMTSFGLDDDHALRRIAGMVHALDVGDTISAEGKGFEAILSGARTRLQADDPLLAEMSNVLDSLYSHFNQENADE